MDTRLIEKLWSNVRKTETCWFWQGATSKAGYGQIRLGPRPGKLYYAHRLSAELAGYSIDGLEVHHKCCVKNCVRPDHLEVVRPDEHPDSGSVINRKKTHCIHGHALTPDNLIRNKFGHRICRACNAYKQRKLYKPRPRYLAGPPLENKNKTHCKRGHEFTPENTYLRSGGKRNCKTCRALAKKRRQTNASSTNRTL
jgi:hypothetical protein